MPVRQLAALKDKLTLENSTTMATAEKIEKLAAAEARLKAQMQSRIRSYGIFRAGCLA